MTPDAYFLAGHEAFTQATERVGERIRRVRIGGTVVELRFAGDQVASLMGDAMAHVPDAATATADISFCLWDEASSGCPMPPPPWSADAYGLQGEIDGFNDGRFRALFQLGSGCFYSYDRDRRIGLCWARDVRKLPVWELSFPCRLLLHWALSETSWQPVHAAALGSEAGAILLTGPSGSGKSTSTLACLAGPLGCLGDDYVLTDCTASPRVQSLYHWAKLDDDALVRLPAMVPLLANPDRAPSDKGVVPLARCLPDRLVVEAELLAIVACTVGGQRDTHLWPVKQSVGASALIPTTLSHLSGDRHRSFRKLTTLCRAVPHFQLSAGTDLTQIPVVISELLKDLAGGRV
ncbi:hypothetical protein [Azospirillum endophyticum]